MQQVTARDVKVDQATLNRIVDQWPIGPKETVQKMTQKYGPPSEATSSRVTWFNNGQWKETTVFRDEVEHDFPRPHKDHIKQRVDYRVPIGKYDQLAEYDGSVTVDRTKGEIAAKCDKEEMNLLALNLANDIVTGRSNVQQARQEYGRQAMAFMKQDLGSAPYTQGLKFNVPHGGTAYPDQPMPGMSQNMGGMSGN